MKVSLLTLLIGLAFAAVICSAVWAQEEEKNDSPKTIRMEAKKETFIVIYKPGAAWIKGKPVTEQPLKEHGKFLLGLYKSKILRYAGPFGDDTGGAAVLEVSNETEARNLLERDPAVTSGVMSYELHPWRLVPWENFVKK